VALLSENHFDSAQECLRRKTMLDADGRRMSPSLSLKRAQDDAGFRHDESGLLSVLTCVPSV